MKSEYIVYDECGNYYAGKIPKAGYTETLWTWCESGAERLSRSKAFRIAASLTRRSGMSPRICHAKKYIRAA